MQAAAVCLLPVSFWIDAPFGKFGVQSRWNVNGNTAWMAMESVAPLAVAWYSWPVQSTYAAVLLGMFIVHYMNRALIQPLLNPPRSPLHLVVVLSAIAFNSANGFLIGTWLRTLHVQHFTLARAVLAAMGFALFGAGMGGNIAHDTILMRLRTSPLAARDLLAMPPFLFVVLEIGAMLPRAVHGHAWYRREFGVASHDTPGAPRIDPIAITTHKSIFAPCLASLAMSGLQYSGNLQLEHLHAKYTGTIHPDTTRHEWITYQHRDTTAAVIGNAPLLSYMSIAEGDTKARTKFELTEPCGPPPFRKE
ncbi:hypothetical protein MVES_002558 [Malassezia vespertilionis]|uniref:3-oxo-5-alpha-steroid 4-dehydrogenase C-terminal domain-containing protein n=1 Tax=Malassezia vespertilionis TaxID=2020962 RepID=A0A2N1JAY2_9BASI|nr:hypothetical protein MVES_002558 [Malassezia vespertilionis]